MSLGLRALQSARWFLENKVRVFPIKSRDKVPACASWDDYAATFDEISSWDNYGVALGPLGVVDSDTNVVESWVEANVPETPFVVMTGRGIHRYYRLIGAAPHFIHRAGHTIEFRNTGQYVVGPGSIHSSGSIYHAREWSWKITDVPFFQVNDFRWDDRIGEQRGSADGQPLILPDTIYAGERHDLLFKLMRSLQARGIEDVEQLLTVLRVANRVKCMPPIDDHELISYIRRVARHRDRPDFVRLEVIDATAMAGNLFEAGAGVDVALAAARALDPTFDPSGTAASMADVTAKAPPDDNVRLKKEIAQLEARIARARADVSVTVEVGLDVEPDEQAVGTPEADLETVELDEVGLTEIDAEEIE